MHMSNCAALPSAVEFSVQIFSTCVKDPSFPLSRLFRNPTPRQCPDASEGFLSAMFYVQEAVMQGFEGPDRRCNIVGNERQDCLLFDII